MPGADMITNPGDPFLPEEDKMVQEMMNSTRRPKWKVLAAEMKAAGYNRTVDSLMGRRRYLNDNVIGFKCVNKLVKSALRNVIRLRSSSEYRSQWQKSNRDKRKSSSKKSREKKKRLPGYKEARAAKDKRLRKQSRERERTRYHSDEKFNSIKKARMRLFNFLKSKGISKAGKTSRLIGLNNKQFAEHLRLQRPDLTLSERHIDHIFPFEQHGMLSLESQQKAMHYSNMQPLTEEENLAKSNWLPTKAMAAKVERWAWPPDITEDMLPDVYEGWSSALRM